MDFYKIYKLIRIASYNFLFEEDLRILLGFHCISEQDPGQMLGFHCIKLHFERDVKSDRLEPRARGRKLGSQFFNLEHTSQMALAHTPRIVQMLRKGPGPPPSPKMPPRGDFLNEWVLKPASLPTAVTGGLCPHALPCQREGARRENEHSD